MTTPDQVPVQGREERRSGHSKLVYNKETRTIDTVDPHPLMDAEERALKWCGEGQPKIMVKAVAVLICQAEQAARQDERRKALEEAAQICDNKVGPMPKDSWAGQMVKRMFKEAAASIRALAKEVT